ncbi:MAG: hypothetical protein AAB212_10820 [Bacteroidota bacterium]
MAKFEKESGVVFLSSLRQGRAGGYRIQLLFSDSLSKRLLKRASAGVAFGLSPATCAD